MNWETGLTLLNIILSFNGNRKKNRQIDIIFLETLSWGMLAKYLILIFIWIYKGSKERKNILFKAFYFLFPFKVFWFQDGYA